MADEKPGQAQRRPSGALGVFRRRDLKTCDRLTQEADTIEP
jgi:hypothetical protein